MKTTFCTEILWEQYYSPLKKFLRNHVSNEQDVEDVLQNVFIKIHNNLSSIKDEDKISAWIYAIARNCIVDLYRTRKREVLIPEVLENFDDVQVPEQDNQNQEVIKCLIKMIDDLPEKYRKALVLAEFNNISQKELGSILGITESGAKSRVQRARAMLRQKLTSCCSFELDCSGNVVEFRFKHCNCKYC